MAPVRLFTLEGAKRRDPSVEQWFTASSPGLRAVARRWFEQMRSSGPDVLELLHDGHPTACIANLPFGYVDAFRDHVNVGFFLGTSLNDPAHLLQGSGRFMRHVQLRPGACIDEKALRELVAAAYSDMKARSAVL